jgi:HD superfamily phosphohydrolase
MLKSNCIFPAVWAKNPKYDLDRIVATVALVERPDGEGFSVGVDEGGIHAVEGLILARYMLFTQVYFHKTRVSYDYHLIEALKAVLTDRGGCLPAPDSAEGVRDYLDWDDWRVLGALAEGRGGDHGRRLKERHHYRRLCATGEVPNLKELEQFEALQQHLRDNGIDAVRRDAEKSWYKFEKPGDEILVRRSTGLDGPRSEPMSICSPVVSKLQAVRRSRLYAPEEQRQKAEIHIAKFNPRGEDET